MEPEEVEMIIGRDFGERSNWSSTGRSSRQLVDRKIVKDGVVG